MIADKNIGIGIAIYKANSVEKIGRIDAVQNKRFVKKILLTFPLI
jgi:hypothetical protein